MWKQKLEESFSEIASTLYPTVDPRPATTDFNLNRTQISYYAIETPFYLFTKIRPSSSLQNDNKAFFRSQNAFTNTPKSRKNPSKSKWMNEEKLKENIKIFLIFRFPFIIINNFCFQGKAWKARTQIHSQSFFGRLLLLFVCVILYGRCGIFPWNLHFFFRSTLINLK